MAADGDLIIEIPSGDIQLGHDKDGLPRTDPVQKPVAGAGGKQETAPAVKTYSQADYEAVQAEALANRKRAEEIAATARTERESRLKAEETAHEATGQAFTAHVRALNADKTTIEAAITSTQALIASTTREMQTAQEAQDFARVGQLTAELGKLGGDLSRANAEKVSVDHQLTRANDALQRAVDGGQPEREAAGQPTQQTQQRQDGPQTPDEWIAGCPPATHDFLKKNKHLVINDKLRRKLSRFGDNYIDDHGQHSVNTAAFLSALEKEFGPKDEPTPQTQQRQQAVDPGSQAVAAAPTNGGQGPVFSSHNPDARTIRLPRDVVDFCKASGLDPTSYALGVHAEIKAGKLPKEWLDEGYNRWG